MKILKWLLENYNVDDDNDMDHIRSEVSRMARESNDECCELANILVLLDNVPNDIFQIIWDHI